MPDKTWKACERRGAKVFGTVRNSLSGGNSKLTRSDSLHPKLYLEQKHAKKQAVWTLYYQTKVKALKEKKIPVLVLHQKGSHGHIVCIHSSHLVEVLRELSQKPVPCESPESKPRRRRKRKSVSS